MSWLTEILDDKLTYCFRPGDLFVHSATSVENAMQITRSWQTYLGEEGLRKPVVELAVKSFVTYTERRARDAGVVIRRLDIEAAKLYYNEQLLVLKASGEGIASTAVKGGLIRARETLLINLHHTFLAEVLQRTMADFFERRRTAGEKQGFKLLMVYLIEVLEALIPALDGLLAEKKTARLEALGLPTDTTELALAFIEAEKQGELGELFSWAAAKEVHLENWLSCWFDAGNTFRNKVVHYLRSLDPELVLPEPKKAKLGPGVYGKRSTYSLAAAALNEINWAVVDELQPPAAVAAVQGPPQPLNPPEF
jgi:hypothetical protein